MEVLLYQPFSTFEGRCDVLQRPFARCELKIVLRKSWGVTDLDWVVIVCLRAFGLGMAFSGIPAVASMLAVFRRVDALIIQVMRRFDQRFADVGQNQ